MYDLRDYKKIIREAVAVEDQKDENWKWRVVSIGKKTVKIGWGYLDYCGEGDKPFLIEMGGNQEGLESGECWLKGYVQDKMLHEPLFVTVGEESWDDAKTIEDAIRMCIHSVAHRAHMIY